MTRSATHLTLLSMDRDDDVSSILSKYFRNKTFVASITLLMTLLVIKHSIAPMNLVLIKQAMT